MIPEIPAFYYELTWLVARGYIHAFFLLWIFTCLINIPYFQGKQLKRSCYARDLYVYVYICVCMCVCVYILYMF